MKKLTTFTFEDDDLKSYREEEFLIIEIKQNAFEIVTDLSESSHLFDLLALTENNPDMKGLFLVNHAGFLAQRGSTWERDFSLHRLAVRVFYLA